MCIDNRYEYWALQMMEYVIKTVSLPGTQDSVGDHWKAWEEWLSTEHTVSPSGESQTGARILMGAPAMEQNTYTCVFDSSTMLHNYNNCQTRNGQYSVPVSDSSQARERYKTQATGIDREASLRVANAATGTSEISYTSNQTRGTNRGVTSAIKQSIDANKPIVLSVLGKPRGNLPMFHAHLCIGYIEASMLKITGTPSGTSRSRTFVFFTPILIDPYKPTVTKPGSTDSPEQWSANSLNANEGSREENPAYAFSF